MSGGLVTTNSANNAEELRTRGRVLAGLVRIATRHIMTGFRWLLLSAVARRVVDCDLLDPRERRRQGFLGADREGETLACAVPVAFFRKRTGSCSGTWALLSNSCPASS